jgi:hypothetical protein
LSPGFKDMMGDTLFNAIGSATARKMALKGQFIID